MSTVGNFGMLGLTLPTGSRQKCEILGVNYLYKGTGNACAGQSNVIVELLFDSKPRKLSVAGNFGNTLPIGSNKRNDISKYVFSLGNFKIKHYLYLGTGKAWAGQRRVRLSPK